MHRRHLAGNPFFFLVFQLYEHFGLKDDPFRIIPDNSISTLVGRENELDDFLRALMNMHSHSVLHIPILGYHGIGKTHFLKYISEAINNNKEELNVSKIIFINGLKDFETEIEQSQKKLNEFESTGKVLYFVDDLDIITLHEKTKAMIFFQQYEGQIIGTRNLKAWTSVKRSVEIKIPKAEPSLLNTLNDDNLQEIIDTRLNSCTIDETKVKQYFPEDILTALKFKSQGNPYSLISAAKRYFNFLLTEKNLEINDSFIKRFTESMKLVSIKETLATVEKIN